MVGATPLASRRLTAPISSGWFTFPTGRKATGAMKGDGRNHFGGGIGLPIHSLQWRTVASAVDEVEVFNQGLAWLTGNSESVVVEKTTSFFGSPLHLVSARLDRRGDARKAVARLGEETLTRIMNSIEERLDDENCIHLRLRLDALLAAKIELAEAGEDRCLKGRIKLRVYPGDVVATVAHKLLSEAADRALRMDWPEPPRQGEEE